VLRTLESIQGYRVTARDDHLGDVADVYFDDGRWRIRYFVASTTERSDRSGLWFSPDMAAVPDDDRSELPVSFTRGQLDQISVADPATPDRDPDRPRLHDERGWPHYWLAPILGRAGGPVAFTSPEGSTQQELDAGGDAHLRSASEIHGYEIVGADGRVGRVSGLICDDDDWQIRFLVGTDGSGVEGNLFIAPSRIERVDRSRSEVHVELTASELRRESRHGPRRYR
jgi:hypothetical protein